MNTNQIMKSVTCLLMAMALPTCAVGISGCGKGGEQAIEKDSTTIPTPVENVRSALKTVADTGEFNSGTELIKDDLEKLRGTAGVDVDALQKDLEALLKTQGANQIRAKANQMIAKLPK